MYIDSGRITDYSAIECLTLLDTIVIENVKKPIDLNLAIQIKHLETEYKYIKNIGKVTALEELSLYKFNPKNKNFKELERLNNLKKLWILFSNIESLDGIDSLKKLKYLEMSEMLRLKDIKQIECLAECITNLRIDNAYELRNFTPIGKLFNLQELALCNNKGIESVHFLNELDNLNSCILEGSTVLEEKILVSEKDFNQMQQSIYENHQTDMYHRDYHINQVLLSMHNFFENNYDTCKYTLNDINVCGKILEEFLSDVKRNKGNEVKDTIKQTVIKLNHLNASTDYTLIETEQRELINSLIVHVSGVESIDYIELFKEW